MPVTLQSRAFCLLILLLKNIKTEIYMTIVLPVLYAYETWSLALGKNLGLGAKGCTLAQV